MKFGYYEKLRDSIPARWFFERLGYKLDEESARNAVPKRLFIENYGVFYTKCPVCSDDKLCVACIPDVCLIKCNDCDFQGDYLDFIKVHFDDFSYLDAFSELQKMAMGYIELKEK